MLWCVLVGETALRIDAAGFSQVSGRLARREALLLALSRPSSPTTPSCRRLTAGCARTTTSEVISAVRKLGNVSREVGGWMPRSRSRMTPPPMPDLWGHGIGSQLLKQAVDSFRTAPTSTTVLAFRAAVSFAAGWACSDLPADRGDRGCGVRWCARAKLRPQTVRFHYSIRRRSLRTGINPGRAVVGSCFTSEHLRGGCLPPAWCQKANQLIITPDHRSSSNNKVKDTEESHVFKINY